MQRTIQGYFFAAYVLLALSTIGCSESYPTPAHGQETGGREIRADTDSKNQQHLPPTREYEVVSTGDDGSTTVEFTQEILRPEPRTRIVTNEGGGQFEETYNAWVPMTILTTVTVPAGEDIDGFLNEGFPKSLPRPEDEEEVLYEIVDRKPDGTTVVQVHVYDFQEQIRTRTITKNGRTVEQCYARYEPTLHEVVTLSLPAGQDILEAVDDYYISVLQSPVDDVPPAPVVASEIPPAPAP